MRISDWSSDVCSSDVVWVAPQVEIAKYEQDKADARIAIEERAEMVPEYIPVNYGSAEDIAKLLTEESKSSMGSGGGGGGSRGPGQRRPRFLSLHGRLRFDPPTHTPLGIATPH